jgi:PAS domain S-box-containing protein
MHRPQSTTEGTPPVQLWLRTCGWPSLILAIAWAVTGRISFLLDVDHVLVTPAFFIPEAFSLAFALRFGAGVWPGIFIGHQLLILGRDLPVLAGLGVSAANTLEAVLAVWLFRRLQGNIDMDNVRSWVLLQAMVFLVLQPFCATLGIASLFAGGVIGDPQAWLAAGLNWWSGSGMAQSQLAPLLLILLHPRARVSWARQIVLPALVTVVVLAVALFVLGGGGVGTSLVLFQPLLVAFALLLGLPAVCVASALISVAFLYATSHGQGPFYFGDATSLFDLNVFLVGISLIGQFLAVLFRQLAKQRATEEELRDAREQLQRTAYELTENIPVGTYVLEFDADGKPHFTFLSERFLAMTGLKREELMANHALALQPMSSSDRSEIERLNREVFASKKPFFWEGEITARGEKRHVTLESTPRSRPGGGTIWEGVMTDVTERRKSEQQLRLVLDNLPIAVAATTLTSPADLTFINKQFTRTFGYTLEDVPTVAAWAEKAYPDPDYRREVFGEWDQAVFRALQTRGTVELMEFEVTCKDGTKRDVVFGAVVLDERLLVSMTDVTELKKAERQVRSLREQLERAAFELTENIPVGTYTMVQPPDGGMAYFSFMSTRFLELTGLERAAAEADPMNAFACVHPDDHAEWVRKNAYVFEHKLPFKEECRVVVDGQTRWITAESTPRDMPDGSVVWEGVLTDITDRRLAEVALRQVTQRMQLAAAAAGIGFWSRDRESRIEEWDDQMFRIYGVSREDFDGRWEPLVHPDDLPVVERLTEEALTAGHTGEYEYRIVRPDGTVRHIRGMSVCASGPQGELLREIGVNFDITEEKVAAARGKQLEEAHRRDLETKLKTSLSASAVAHEINQPLSSILLQSKMALQQGEDSGKALQVIAEEAQRMVVTIDKMKTLLRNVRTDQRAIDLAEVAQSALLYNKGLLAKHRIKLRTAGLDHPCRITGDDAQLQLTITNLIRNAAEAIAEARPKKREIALDLTATGDAVELVLGDSGPGWPADGPAEVPLSTTKKSGTGIGLYVVRTAMDNHRGDIVFGRSALGGAEVRLRFPRAKEKT